MDEYDGRQFVGIDLHRRRSVIVRQSESGEQLSAVRIVNDPVALGLQLEQAGSDPEVVLEATYGWYWAVDVLQACGAHVPSAILWASKCSVPASEKAVRDAAFARSAADVPTARGLDRPLQTRESRELVRYRASGRDPIGTEGPIDAVLAQAGVLIAASDLFGVTGR